MSSPSDLKPAPRAIVFASAAVLAALSCACLGSTTTTTRFHAEQTALVAPAEGPLATGALVPDRTIALEGAFSGSEISPSGRDRSDTQPGHVIPAGEGHARIAVGFVDRVEVGAGLDVSIGKGATSVASDVPAGTHENDLFVRGGFQFRGIVVGTRRFGLGFGGEASVASVPYRRTVLVNPGPAGSFGTGEHFESGGSTMVPYTSVNAFVIAQPARVLTLTLGAMVQTIPVFFGAADFSQTCTTVNLTTSCTGTAPEQLGPYTLEAIGTGFASVTLSAGPLDFIGQFFANFAGPSSIVSATPFGGGIAMRANLGFPARRRHVVVVPEESETLLPTVMITQ